MRFLSSGRLCGAVELYALPGILRQGMVRAQDPGFDSDDVLDIGLGFINTTEFRTGDGIRKHCFHSIRVSRPNFALAKATCSIAISCAS